MSGKKTQNYTLSSQFHKFNYLIIFKMKDNYMYSLISV